MSTTNFPVGTPGLHLLPIHIGGQHTANVTAIARFKLPFRANLIGVSAAARASGGTTPTLTVDVKVAGTSALSAPVAVTAGAVAEAAIATPAVADEAVVTIDLAIDGTTPTWDDIDVLLTLVRV